MGLKFKLILKLLSNLLKKYENDFQIGVFYVLFLALREVFGDNVIRQIYYAVTKVIDDLKLNIGREM